MANYGVTYFEPHNPDTPYFAIKIEDKIYDIETNYIENLTVKRLMDDVGEFSFIIINYYDLLEGKDLENRLFRLFAAYEDQLPPITFEYGWALGEKSGWKYGQMKDFTTEYVAGGFHRINVTGILMGSEGDQEQVEELKGNSITEIFSAVAANNNWIVDQLDQSVPFSEERSFRISNIDPVSYVRKELEPYAVTENNMPFKFYVEEKEDGTHVRFVAVNTFAGDRMYNFFINMGNYGSVLSWSPTYSGYTMAAFMQAAMVDNETNDVHIYGSPKKGPTGQSNLTVYGSTSPDRMQALIANKWFQTNVAALKASLTIIGDPTLQPYMQVNVMPMLANGEPHRPTAGVYTILQITDTLSPGDYQTEMELQQMGEDQESAAAGSVEEQAVE